MRGQTGFFDIDERLRELSAKGEELERLNALFDFEQFRGDLERAVPRSDRSRGGRPAFEHGIQLSRMLTDRGTEFCGTQSHEYELYLPVEDIDHSRIKTKSPQTTGICERFHRTVLDEFYRVAFRKNLPHYRRATDRP